MYLTVYVRFIPYKSPVLVPISTEIGTKLGLLAEPQRGCTDQSLLGQAKRKTPEQVGGLFWRLDSTQCESACLAASIASLLSPLEPLKYRFKSTALMEASKMPDSISGWMLWGIHCR